MALGSLTTGWLKTEHGKWLQEEDRKKKAEQTQQKADAQADEKWKSLLANLKELKGQAYRGISFKWSEDYGLLYDNACARVHLSPGGQFRCPRGLHEARFSAGNAN
ncbi:MAG: hypothetical protein QOK38_801 [Acidobacteriaceae bacterium]|jgi:hypothetical protein|nr:hypothetical protein [Acidobacteriaceae bacterium]